AKPYFPFLTIRTSPSWNQSAPLSIAATPLITTLPLRLTYIQPTFGEFTEAKPCASKFNSFRYCGATNSSPVLSSRIQFGTSPRSGSNRQGVPVAPLLSPSGSRVGFAFSGGGCFGDWATVFCPAVLAATSSRTVVTIAVLTAGSTQFSRRP